MCVDEYTGSDLGLKYCPMDCGCFSRFDSSAQRDDRGGWSSEFFDQKSNVFLPSRAFLERYSVAFARGRVVDSLAITCYSVRAVSRVDLNDTAISHAGHPDVHVVGMVPLQFKSVTVSPFGHHLR